MPFQHNNFGLLKNPLINSPYVQNFDSIGSPTPPPGNFLLLENDGKILLEDGSAILLEN